MAWMLVERPRAEDGCLDFGGYRDIMGSDALLVVGRWIDQRALERHYESAHSREIIGRFAELLAAAAPSISLYQVVEMDRL